MALYFGMIPAGRVNASRPFVLLALLLLCLEPRAVRGADAPPLITVGEVTETSAVVWARWDGLGPVTVEYRARGGERDDLRRAAAQATAAKDFTVKILLTGLSPFTAYEYRVSAGGFAVAGHFRTAPPPGRPEPVTFLWSGDLGGAGHCRDPREGYRIFAPMTRLAPDFFLFVGDTIYADHRCRPGTVPGADFAAQTLREFRLKHRYNRADPQVQAFFQATAVYAIWDDHEVVNDFAGPSERLMPIGRQAFLEYWPIVPLPEEPGRLYRRIPWGQILELFVLDTRQYRSPNSMADGPGKTMLGERQRRWLLDGLAASNAVWKIVVSSVTLSVSTGRDHRDGWASGSTALSAERSPSGFEHELQMIVRALADLRIKNLVWISADVHHAEIIRYRPRVDFTFYELIAGPLSASRGRPRPLDQTLSPVSLFARGDFFNFGQIALDAHGLTVRIYDEGGVPQFKHTIAPQP